MPFIWYDNALNNMTATTDPTVNNDVTEGYTSDPPSTWINTTTNCVFILINNTQGAAQWVDVSGGAGSFTNLTATGDATLRTLITSPEQAQNITAAGDTVPSTNTHIHLVPDADYVLTATPTIAAGVDGQWLIIHNTTNFTLDFQDNSVLAGSDVYLGGGEGTLRPMGTMLFHYNSDIPGWSLVSNPNTAAAGANATILQVRNQSGGALTAGQVVYLSGWNNGLNRPLVDLADANNAAAMPAIGVAAATIGNGSNGEVITFGNAVGLINTAGQSVGQGVWVDTTPGDVTFSRPAVDQIQRIGTVTRVNASGNIFVTGAGRTNDTPIAIPDGTTGTLQAPGTNSSLLATTSYVNNVGIWVKVPVTFLDFATAGLTNSIDIYTLEPRFAIGAAFIKHSTSFGGGGIASYTISIGIGGTLQKFANNFDVFQAAGDTTLGNGNTLPMNMEDAGNPTTILATAISTGANLDQANAGDAELQLYITKMED